MAQYQTIPPSALDYNVLTPDWGNALEGFWHIAQTNHRAFSIVRRSTEKAGNDCTIDEDLVGYIHKLHPCNMRDLFDPYTMEVLEDIWCNACANPSILVDLFSVNPPSPLQAAHRALFWSIWKLETNNYPRIRRPGSTPVHGLPNELLRIIFQELRTSYPRYPRGLGLQDVWDRSSHLIARQVCARWRSIIDGTSALWTPMILDFDAKTTVLALELARDAKLDIVAPYPFKEQKLGPVAPKIIASLEPKHLCHVRTLDVVTSSRKETEQILALLAATPSAPLLEYFHLRSSDLYSSPRTLSFSSHTFATDHPHGLLSVIVKDLSLSLPNVLFQPSLVNLDLEQCRVWSSLDEMLDTLSCLQRLEMFRWRQAEDLMPADGETHSQTTFLLDSSRVPIKLPFLKKLSIESPVAYLSALFPHITMPSTCSISFLDDWTLANADHVGAVINTRMSLRQTLGLHLRQAQAAQPDAVCHEVRLVEHARVSATRSYLSVVGHGSDGYPPPLPLFAISIQLRSNDMLLSLLQDIMSWVEISSSVRLYVNDPAIGHFMLWPLVLGFLPNLHSVELGRTHNSDASTNVTAFTQAIGVRGLIPALSRISLRRLTFPPSAQRALASIIRDRYTLQHPIVALRIEDCDVDIACLEVILELDGARRMFYDDALPAVGKV